MFVGRLSPYSLDERCISHIALKWALFVYRVDLCRNSKLKLNEKRIDKLFNVNILSESLILF